MTERLLPLYDQAGVLDDRPEDAHAGLWFDKFCDKWLRSKNGSWTLSAAERGGGEESARKSPKLAWIETVTESPVGDPQHLEDYWRRMIRLVRSRQGRFWVIRADERFVTGLGRRHPIENGFAWHPTLGTPYLPGSSLKGMIRAWGKAEGGNVDEVLGSPGKVGRIAFLDAIPIAPVRLEADVMTPHYAGWTENDPPADWRSPNPIPFLVAAARTTLVCAAVPAAGKTGEEVVSDLDQVEDWLPEALDLLGAGAKTAVGYGRFTLDEREKARLEEEVVKEEEQEAAERRRVQLSSTSEGRWQLRLEDMQAQLQAMTEQAVLDRAKQFTDANGPIDQVEAYIFTYAVDQLGYLERWVRGEHQPKTTIGAKKLKNRAKKLRLFLDEPPPLTN